MSDAAPLPLMVWLSPAFPVGSFAHSHGLEWAVDAGRIVDRATAEAWLADLLAAGGPHNDAILLAAAWNAVTRDDDDALRQANELALALAGSRERHLETTAQGNAFMGTVLAAWATERLRRAHVELTGTPHLASAAGVALAAESRGLSPLKGDDPGSARSDLTVGPLVRGRKTIECKLADDIAYPVAVGMASAAHSIALGPTLRAFLAATVGNLVSALVRLSVIGQTDGQRIIAALAPAIERLVAAAAQSTLADIGGATFMSDIAAMAHETQETRLFRT